MSRELKEKIKANRVANEKLTDAMCLIQETVFDTGGDIDPKLAGLIDALKIVCANTKYRMIQNARYDGNSWLCSVCNEDLSVLFDVYDGSLLREDSEIFGECVIKYCPCCGQRLIFNKYV